MNVETGEIKSSRDLTKEQKECGKWIQLNKTNVKLLQGMNRKERREYAKENGGGGKMVKKLVVLAVIFG